jgi:acyl transferase domain-containing protein
MSRLDDFSPLKRALLAVEKLERKLERAEQRGTAAIAIVGMGCRFPGGGNPEEFWRLLAAGAEAIGEIPAGRFRSEGHADETFQRRGGFLGDIAGFDAGFFRISPREASRMDPQQRLFLEVVWEALENAGIPPLGLSGSATAVYAGAHAVDYAHLAGMADCVDAHYSQGVDASYIAGRVSYFLGLHGPSMAVDTACSSSLTAVHLACQSLRYGEASLAIAGGVKLILSPRIGIFLAKAGAISRSGVCRAFDAEADGMVQGEGCGVVVLKRLEEALASGDRILAVIRGSAVNHDGPGSGLTAPNAAAQEMLLAETLRRARVSPADVAYLEAHGTGTPVGDPIELEAIARAYGRNRTPARPLAIGSVKTNIGHTESAAGIAGLIKAVLILRNGAIPASLHFTTPNPGFLWGNAPLAVAAAPAPLESIGGRALAAVSSFGMSGVNAHVIVEDAPAAAAGSASQPVIPASNGARTDHEACPTLLLPLSAQSGAALDELARRYREFLAQPAAPLAEICYTAGVRRSHHHYRLAALGESASEIAVQLEAYMEHRPARGLVRGTAAGGLAARPAFVFSGQGQQWWGMGAQLLEAEPVFRRHAEACDEIFQRLAGWSILKEMSATEAPVRIFDTEFVQPALFIVQTGLVSLLASHGVHPGAVAGHSAGEIAAAYAAGVYSLEDAARVAFHRGRIMQRATGLGRMAAVALAAQEAESTAEAFGGRLSLAAVNGSRSCVLSGDPDPLAEALAGLQARGVATDPLRIPYAFHSHQMEALQGELVDALAEIPVAQPRIPFFSTVTGRRFGCGDFQAPYWGRNIRQTVLFHPVLEALLADGFRTFLEISPHPVLVPAIAECIEQAGVDGAAIPSLHRKVADRFAMRLALAHLYCRGCTDDFSGLYPGGTVVSLPSYPWQKERFWFDDERGPVETRRPSHGSAGHPLLGRPIRPANQPGTSIWEIELSLETMPYLRDHRMGGEAVFPGVLFLEMAMEAAAAFFPGRPARLHAVAFHQMLPLREGVPVRLQLVGTREADGAAFQFLTPEPLPEPRGPETWRLHASGRVSADSAPAPSRVSAGLDRHAPQGESSEAFYAALAERGIQYGPAFQGITRIWRGQGEIFAELRPTQWNEPGYRLPPGVFDSCLHAALALADAAMAPCAMAGLRFGAGGEAKVSHVVVRPDETRDGDNLLCDVAVLDESGSVVLAVDGLELRRLPPERNLALADLLYEVRWQKSSEFPVARAGDWRGGWLVFADAAGTGEALRNLLLDRGVRCILARAGSRFAQRGPLEYELDPARPEDYALLLRHCAVAPERPSTIAHLWSLDTYRHAQPAGFEAAQALGSHSVAHLIQALAGAGWTKLSRVWLVTREAQAAREGESPDAAQTTLVGLARTIPYEHPEIPCTLVDLDQRDAAESARLLLDEFAAAGEESEIARRGEERYSPRMVKAATAPRPVSLRPAGTYLVTGGLGGIGLALAEWLVANGARHVALTGRRAPSPEALETMARLSRGGAAVRFLPADAAQYGEMESVLGEIGRSMAPLRGVFHAAGILDDGLLREMTRDRFQSVMAPKVAGSWNLHALTRQLELDHFVLFSSTASLIGSPGQANYAAANAFLDALAHLRRAAGLPGLSINWGAWRSIGMASAGSHRGERLAARGLQSISPAEGFAALGALLNSRHAQCAVVRFSPSQWRRHYPQAGRSSALLDLMRQGAASDKPVIAVRQLRDDLRSASSIDEQRGLLEGHVREQVAQVTGLTPARVDARAPFLALGIDSLMAIELRNRMLTSLEVSPPLQRYLKDSNVARLVDDLLDRLAVNGLISPASSAVPVEEDMEHISL